MNKPPGFYDRFSIIYDWVSTKAYYKTPRAAAIQELFLKKDQLVLSVACRTGQSFEHFQNYLEGSGLVVGIDLSEGMLAKAQIKIDIHNWSNIKLIECDAATISSNTIKDRLKLNEVKKFDSAICELGLTAIPDWEKVIDTMINLVKPGGKIVIMDWYMKAVDLRGKFINWVGNGDITKPTWQYLKSRVDNFRIDSQFKKGDVFVGSGSIRQSNT